MTRFFVRPDSYCPDCPAVLPLKVIPSFKTWVRAEDGILKFLLWCVHSLSISIYFRIPQQRGQQTVWISAGCLYTHRVSTYCSDTAITFLLVILKSIHHLGTHPIR